MICNFIFVILWMKLEKEISKEWGVGGTVEVVSPRRRRRRRLSPGPRPSSPAFSA